MKTKIKSILRILLFFCLGIGFIWWFIAKLSSEELNQLFQSFKEANYFWFVIAIFINIASHAVRALRWRQLIEPMGYKTRFIPTFLSVMCGYLANLAVPRLGEVVRCGMLRKKEKVPFEKAIGTVITERAVDMLLFLIILGLSLILEFNYIKDYLWNNFNSVFNFSKLKSGLILLTLGFIFTLLMIFFLRKKIVNTKLYKKIKELVLGLWQGMKTILKVRNPLLFIVYSLTIWLLWILGTYVIFLCLSQTSSLTLKIAVIATILGAIGPMVTPGGIGIFPAIIAETLAIYSITKPIGYACGWLLWIVSQVGVLILGLFGFVYFSLKDKKDDSNRKNSF